jgi:hypothetical protein
MAEGCVGEDVTDALRGACAGVLGFRLTEANVAAVCGVLAPRALAGAGVVAVFGGKAETARAAAGGPARCDPATLAGAPARWGVALLCWDCAVGAAVDSSDPPERYDIPA